MNTSKETIILLGTDTPIGLAVIRDLGNAGYRVIGLGKNNQSIGSASVYCDTHFMRETTDNLLVKQIIDIANEYKAYALMAISEYDLVMLNTHREALEKYLKILTPTTDMLDAVLDKNICLKNAESCGINIPKTLQIKHLDDLQNHDLKYPVILKWADPNAIMPILSKHHLEFLKTEIILNASELLSAMGRYVPVNLYPLIQEYHAGNGLGQIFLMDNGKPLVRFQHKRIHEWPPEGGVSTLCESVPLDKHQEIQKLSENLLRKLNWHGIAMVEYRYDMITNTYVFMEINGRFWGSLPLAIQAGMPFAASLVNMSLNKSIAQPNYKQIRCCYWIPETRRMIRIVFQSHKINRHLFQFKKIHTFFNWLWLCVPFHKYYYVFQLNDPKPFFQDIGNIIKKICKLK